MQGLQREITYGEGQEWKGDDTQDLEVGKHKKSKNKIKYGEQG